MFEEGKFPGYNEVQLHYMEKLEYQDSLVPVLIIPALPESAIDYKDLIYLLENRTIAFTYRGREQSDAPNEGYSIFDHGRDILSAINHFKLNNVVIIAYSRGVAYFFEILPEIKEKIKGVIIIDHPPIFTSLSKTWPAQFLNQSWRAMPNKERFPKPIVLQKIQEESVETEYWDRLDLLKDIPTLLMIGARDYTDPFLIRSKVSDEDLHKYQSLLPLLKLVEFEKSGHDLRLWEYDKFVSTIKDFLNIFKDPEQTNSDETNPENKKSIKHWLTRVFNKSPGIDKKKIIKLKE